jgi:hypothetical protein
MRAIMEKVQCSFCNIIFPQEEIERKAIENQTLAKILPEHLVEFVTIKKEGDHYIGEHCPHCGHLHIVGFREIYSGKIV